MKEIICSDIWELTRKSFHYKMETEFKIYHTRMIINRLIYKGFLVCDTFFAFDQDNFLPVSILCLVAFINQLFIVIYSLFINFSFIVKI
jgi:hypothetical protein